LVLITGCLSTPSGGCTKYDNGHVWATCRVIPLWLANVCYFFTTKMKVTHAEVNHFFAGCGRALANYQPGLPLLISSFKQFLLRKTI